jgi:amino acid transporter
MRFFSQLFATKSLEQLHREMKEDEGRLRRVLGPVGLTSLGIGAIIGAGIFVMTGRVAADNAGPAVMLSYVIAALGCAFAAFCYAEFASLAPVAGSAYTYAYATLGELMAWIIGWDLILEYAMSAATVASAWSEYFNELLVVLSDGHLSVPDFLLYDPISKTGAWFNLPAVVILLIVTTILVIGIRESAFSNTLLVVVKVGVVVFVIAVGLGYVTTRYWTDIPPEERKLPQQQGIPDAVKELAHAEHEAIRMARTIAQAHLGDSPTGYSIQFVVTGQNGPISLPIPVKRTLEQRARELESQSSALYMIAKAEQIVLERTQSGKLSAEEARQQLEEVKQRYGPDLPKTADDRRRAQAVLDLALVKAQERQVENWGAFAELGVDRHLAVIDDKTRSNFTPYGLSGVMLGAALVFFAFIGFDSISTHAEEAVKPQRDVPIGIITSLVVCTILYIGVSAVITGMKPYPEIDVKAAVASAFRQKAEEEGGNPALRWAGALIALGGLAGMTSVLLITLLSQARIFLAMARDGLLPRSVFGTVHEKFKTPHVSTIVTGLVITVVAAFTPIQDLEKMVNIGTLFAFVVVCAAVLLLRWRRPDAHRPFKAPLIWLVAPAGIVVNVVMMLFLPTITWLRLIGWLFIGLVIYLGFGWRHSALARQKAAQLEQERLAPT